MTRQEKVTKKTVACKYRVGSDWRVSSYRPQYDEWSPSSLMSYREACAEVKEARETWNTKKQEYELDLIP